IGTFTKQTDVPELTYTLDREGDYPISVVVEDPKMGSAESNAVTVYAGNEAPGVEIVLSDTSGFYRPGQLVQYEVQVNDHGNAADEANLFVSVEYVKETDMAGASIGHEQVSEAIMGRNIMLSSDCQSYHKENEVSVGPSYRQVSKRYQGKDGASN